MTSAGASALLAFLLVVPCAQAGRVKDASSTSMANKTVSAVEPALEAERNLTQRRVPLKSNDIEWDALGLVHESHTQQFKVLKNEDDFYFELKKYEDENGQTVQSDIDTKLMKLQTNMVSLYGCVTVTIEAYEQWPARSLQVCKPQVVFNKVYSWRVYDGKEVLFTIQKSYWNADRNLGLFGGRPVWKIYNGHKGDKRSLIYYGTTKGNDETKDLKFWHNEDEYAADMPWATKIEHDEEEDSEYKFKVKVKPNEDTAVLLITIYCVDFVALF